MNPIASVFLLLGSLVALLAGIGLLTFTTPYARFHAAGKAAPIAFLLVAIGAGIEVGPGAAAELAIVAAALLLTLPASTRLLFRATHRTTESAHLSGGDLAVAERELAASDPPSGERPEEGDDG